MKTCKRCGESKDESEFHRNKRKVDGLDIYCKACNSERMREKYAADPEWRKAKITRTRQYHVDNPEWSRERLRAHHVQHRAERLAKMAERKRTDPEYAAKKRESTRRSESRRRALKAQVDAVDLISRDDLEQLLIEYGGRCYICDVELGADLHWDHYQPLAHGGAHVLDNLRPACSHCNVRKNAIWPITAERLQEIKSEVLALRKAASRVPSLEVT